MKTKSFIAALAVSGASALQCRNVSVSVDISARNSVFSLQPPASTIDMINSS